MNESADVLARHAAALRRPRIVYFAVVAVIVVALGVFAGVAWSRGEAAHVSLHTAPRPAPTLPLAVPAQTQQRAWTGDDRAALGSPQYGGTVVTWRGHTVRGRDARTGHPVWSYTRADRTLCTAAQLDGTTIAVYAVHGNCDEVSAFVTGTGRRAWTRTLDKDGMPLNGHPAYQWTNFTFMLTTSSVIYAIDPTSGLDRWTYTRYGCRIQRAVLGSGGALISQDCVHPQCGNLVRCGPGPQLLLRDGSAGNGDDSKSDRDQVKWNDLGTTDVPVSADSVISALNTSTRQLSEYRVDNGKPITAVRLAGSPSSAAGSVAHATSDAQLIWLGGVTYALSAGRPTPIWATPTVSAPTVLAPSGDGADLATGRFTVATASGAAVLDGTTGRASVTSGVAAPPRGSLVYPLGQGYLVAAPHSVSAYR